MTSHRMPIPLRHAELTAIGTSDLQGGPGGWARSLTQFSHNGRNETPRSAAGALAWCARESC